MSWFPVVGAGIGAVVGCVWWSADRLWPPAVAAALALAADLALTGMLHVDGLADAADGLLPHLPRQRRLEVMTEPAIGAYGITVTASVLLLRFAALSSMQPSILLIAGAWCASRTVMAVAARALPYARTEGGLATVMLGGDWRPVGLYGVIASVSLVAFAGGRGAEIAVAAGLLASAGVVLFARRRLGGFTGDVLGAAGVVGETAALVVAAAKW
jgi:adenosylcobinamide-GDP ribazoletransferase